MSFFNKRRIYILIIVLLAVIISLYYLRTQRNNNTLITQRYYRLTDTLDYIIPSLPLNQAMADAIMGERVVGATHFADATFVLFETLNHVDDLMKKVKFPNALTHINGVCGTDFMASKSSLAYMFRQVHGDKVFAKYLPVTYILSIEEDRKRLQDASKQTYIVKKNIQRQEGYLLCDNANDVLDAYAKDNTFVVAQQVLQDPYLVNGRKVNMRVYMLVTVDAVNRCKFYIYKNGFMYYTRQAFQPNTMDPDHIITTGYVERIVYQQNPLDFNDLRKHMGDENYTRLFNNIIRLMKKVRETFTFILEDQNRTLPGMKFLVYGCDVAPDDNLDVKLMEINKGPDMSYKDSRDKNVKLNMVKDAFSIVGILPPNRNNNFVQV